MGKVSKVIVETTRQDDVYKAQDQSIEKKKKVERIRNGQGVQRG